MMKQALFGSAKIQHSNSQTLAHTDANRFIQQCARFSVQLQNVGTEHFVR